MIVHVFTMESLFYINLIGSQSQLIIYINDKYNIVFDFWLVIFSMSLKKSWDKHLNGTWKKFKEKNEYYGVE